MIDILFQDETEIPGICHIHRKASKRNKVLAVLFDTGKKLLSWSGYIPHPVPQCPSRFSGSFLLTRYETIVAPAITHVNIIPTKKDAQGNQLYSASNPYWTASITPRPGAKSYTMRVIKNGQKMNPTKVTPHPSDSTWAFRICRHNFLFDRCALEDNESHAEKDGSFKIAYEQGFPNIAWVT